MKKKYKKMQLGGGFLPPITINDMMDFMSNLSVPQKLATKAVTGKYQTPSEAMGIKNKAGAFATDMILDPVNLLGAGMVRGVSSKVGNLSKVSKAVPQHTEEIVRGPINWWDEPTFKKNNPNITGEQYINNVSKYGRHTIEPVEALTPFDMRTLSKEQYKDFISRERLRTRTYNNPLENLPKKKQNGGTTNPTDGGQNSARSSTAKERESWNKFYKYMYDNKIAGSKDLDLRDKSLGMSYLDKFNQLNPEYKVNPEFIKIAQQEAALLKQGIFPEVNSTLDFPLNQYKNKQLSPVDGWLGSITSSQISYPTIQKSMGDGTKRDFGYDYAAYKAFLESEPRATAKLRKGGPVVDPMGQWAHPGKHTIVPTKSGNITMQGVPYPVFGKDETGYSQMMMPGGEYNFPGKTVYEVPMMQQGGQFFRDIMLSKYQQGAQVNLFGAPNNFAWNPFGTQTAPLPAPTGQPMYRVDQTQGTPVAQQTIVPIQQGKGPGQWVPKTNTTWEPNVEAASMVTGGMGMIADQMNKIPDSRIYNNQVNRATSDASYQTYNPTLKRGYIDQNSGRMAPTNQTLTQFGNAPAPSYYGNLPIAQMGGLPDMGIPDDPTFSIDALVDAGLPSLPSSYMPTGAPSSIPSLAPSKVSVDDAEFLTYMAHQQGEAGIKALTKAARSGQDWREFYKGKENLDTNMRSNINPQEFFKKYDALNAGTFLDYWKGKFNKQSSKWGKKSTQFDELINQVAPQFGFSPNFVKTVVGMESSFDPNASAGSHKGLLQLNEKEARRKGVKDVYNPVENLMAGLQMMAQKRDRLAKMQFKEGGEYDLSLEEVNRLRKLGYDLEEIS